MVLQYILQRFWPQNNPPPAVSNLTRSRTKANSIDIPQDIIDNVIAAVGDDTNLLKQCNLVSSSFLRPSRKQLFSRITISHETCKGIHQLFVQNPVILSFVRTITVMEYIPNGWIPHRYFPFSDSRSVV